MTAFKISCAKIVRSMRCVFAMGLIVSAPCVLHASDSDGFSDFNGAFLTFRVVDDHDHLAFLSYKVTPATRSAFTKACAQGKQVWINDRHFPCLASEATGDQQAVQVEIPLDAEKSMSSSYYLVSVLPTTFATLRSLNEQERAALQAHIDSAEKDRTEPHVTAANLIQAKATNGLDRSLVFIPHGKDKDGNQPTYVFSISDGEGAYVGDLPNWPEKLVDIGRNGTPHVIVHLAGDTEVVQSYSIWPQVKSEMFVGTGG